MKINKQQFTLNELGFIYSCLNCLQYEQDTQDEEEQDYNKKLNYLKNKIRGLLNE